MNNWISISSSLKSDGMGKEGLRCFFERTNLKVTGIVHNYVNPTIRAHSLLCDDFQFIERRCDIELQNICAFCVKSLQGGDITTGSDDFLATLEKCASQISTKAGTIGSTGSEETLDDIFSIQRLTMNLILEEDGGRALEYEQVDSIQVDGPYQ